MTWLTTSEAGCESRAVGVKGPAVLKARVGWGKSNMACIDSCSRALTMYMLQQKYPKWF